MERLTRRDLGVLLGFLKDLYTLCGVNAFQEL